MELVYLMPLHQLLCLYNRDQMKVVKLESVFNDYQVIPVSGTQKINHAVRNRKCWGFARPGGMLWLYHGQVPPSCGCSCSRRERQKGKVDVGKSLSSSCYSPP
jgi:hypothetical protein